MRNIRVFIDVAPFILCLAIGIVIGLSFAFTSPGSTAAAAPKPTPQIVNVTVRVTPTFVRVQDPIIGGWRYGYSTGYNDVYRFNAGGTYIETFYDIYTGKSDVFTGTWYAQGNNSYITFDAATNKSNMFIYSPIENGIFSTEHPTILLTPYHGDVMTALGHTQR